MNKLCRLILATVVSLGFITVAQTAPTVSAYSGCSHQVARGIDLQVYGMRSKCNVLSYGIAGGHEYVWAKISCSSANGLFVHFSNKVFANNTYTAWVYCWPGEGNAYMVQDVVGFQNPWP